MCDQEELDRLMLANARLLGELQQSRKNISDARSRLDDPKCNQRFEEARLERYRCRNTEIVTKIRDNRIKALIILSKN